jgi:hypothetical protein
MNLGDVERQLRAGPPEEESYQIQPLLLDLDRVTPTQRLAAARLVARLAPRAVTRLRLAGAIVGMVALVGAGFVAGRVTAPESTSGGPAGQAGVRLQPAFVSDALRQAFYSGVDRQSRFLVCSAASSLTCTDALTYKTANPLGDYVWGSLTAVTLQRGDIIVGAQLDPVLPVEAYLSRAEEPSKTGPQLVPVTIYPGDTFFDLGSPAPGAYVLSIVLAPSSPVMPGQIAIGIVVQ